MALRTPLGLLSSALTFSVAEGGFASWMMGKAGFQAQGLTGRFQVSGHQLLVDGEPFHLKGVCWSPVPLGGEGPGDKDYSGFVELDGNLMQEAGMNVLRVYDPILNTTVLDILWSKGIRVIQAAYIYGGDPLSVVAERVNALKDHPGLLMWEVGNEWNYNNLYYGPDVGGDIDTFEKAVQRVVDVVGIIKDHDTVHPVVTVYGELPDKALLERLDEVDIWAINSYRSDDFEDLFSSWNLLSDKPMYFGEYGADAYDARNDTDHTPGVNLSAQAYATRVLTEQINLHSSLNGGVCLGGLVFSLTDEWWKADNSCETCGPWTHDVGGIAPGGGPYPDLTFNEEYWGLCDIYRNRRPAFEEYKNVAMPKGPARPVYGPQQVVWAAVALLGVITLCLYINSDTRGQPDEVQLETLS